MNGQNIDGRPIRVDFAEERGSGESRGHRITCLQNFSWHVKLDIKLYSPNEYECTL